MKGYLSLLALVLSSFFSFGQTQKQPSVQNCEEIGNEILLDSNLNVWTYPNLSLNDYYCLGQFFANWDLQNGNYLIQTYGSPEYKNTCLLCNYEEYGIYFFYHFDIIIDSRTQFIKGYNEISKLKIKEKFGDSIFVELDFIDSNLISPQKVLDYLLNEEKYSYLNVTVINDTICNVKLNLDVIENQFSLDLSELRIKVEDVIYKTETKSVLYREMKENGILLRERSNNKYFLSLEFDFRSIAQFCFCDRARNEGKVVIPITIKD